MLKTMKSLLCATKTGRALRSSHLRWKQSKPSKTLRPLRRTKLKATAQAARIKGWW